MINNLNTILHALADSAFIWAIILVVTILTAWVITVEKRGGWDRWKK